MEQDEFATLLPSMELKERVLLGYLMLDGEEALRRVFVEEQLDRRAFFFAETRATFSCIQEMFNQGIPVDPSTVFEFMIHNNYLREINGVHSINDFLFAKQYIEAQNEHYSLDYLLNMISAWYEYREMYFLTKRYDMLIVGGDDEVS